MNTLGSPEGIGSRALPNREPRSQEGKGIESGTGKGWDETGFGEWDVDGKAAKGVNTKLTIRGRRSERQELKSLGMVMTKLLRLRAMRAMCERLRKEAGA